jgi:hypothetical protein
MRRAPHRGRSVPGTGATSHEPGLGSRHGTYDLGTVPMAAGQDRTGQDSNKERRRNPCVPVSVCVPAPNAVVTRCPVFLSSLALAIRPADTHHHPHAAQPAFDETRTASLLTLLLTPLHSPPLLLPPRLHGSAPSASFAQPVQLVPGVLSVLSARLSIHPRPRPASTQHPALFHLHSHFHPTSTPTPTHTSPARIPAHPLHHGRRQVRCLCAPPTRTLTPSTGMSA